MGEVQRERGECCQNNRRVSLLSRSRQQQQMLPRGPGEGTRAAQQNTRGQCRPRGKAVELKSLSRVRLFATPRTVAYQAPPSMGFSRQEY